MLVTKKMLLALTLVGALVGAGIGALATRSSQTTTAANSATESSSLPNSTVNAEPANYTNRTPDQIAADNSAQYSTTVEQTAYRQGFQDGYSACTNGSKVNNSRTAYQTNYQPRRATTRYSSHSRRVYYDYGTTSHGRSFWQKHRDKLTLAMGTGLGAAIGGIAGGGKGAGIGALAGLGGSALYTYKLRHRSHRY